MKERRFSGQLRKTALYLVFALIVIVGNCDIITEITISQVNVTENQSLADMFSRHTVTGITTPLPQTPDVPGFVGAAYITVGDIDGDGIKEIICTSGTGQNGDMTADDGAVALFTWDGHDIDTWNMSVLDSTFAFPNETVLHDMDDDGDLDIMVMDNFLLPSFSAGIYYLENKGGEISETSNWEKQAIFVGDDTPVGKSAYHRAIFLDIDGDDREDFITSKVCMSCWMESERYMWMEWFKKEETGFSGPYEIGDGGGFLFTVGDVDRDGDLDVIAPQFFIMRPGTLTIKGSKESPDPHGDSIVWFENPGASGSGNLWNRYTIDNWYTSQNPTGRGFDTLMADIDKDGVDELLFGSHNHQDYRPRGSYDTRIWPSGIFLFEIPNDPKRTENWLSITFDAGDPDLDPYDAEAVAADIYAVDRSGTPFSEGSPGPVSVEDVDGDGAPDLVVSGDGKGILYYYQNNSVSGAAVNYMRATLYHDPISMPADSEIVDIDGDGDKDIVVGIWDTSVNKDATSSSIFIFRQK